MYQLAQQSDVIHPAEAFLDAIALLRTDSVAGVACGAPNDEAPPACTAFCTTCGVTFIWRHSAANSRVSKPLSPLTVIHPSPGTCYNISRAASSSARPLAYRSSASTISPLRFSTSSLPL